jgi:hypothetical protein
LKLLQLACWIGLVVGLIGSTVSPALSQGTSGAASLNITPGARADGMGRAHVALVNDATANWWNPAALANLRGYSGTLMHTKLVPDLADDVYYEYLGVSGYAEGWGGFGFNLIFLTYGESIATDEQGNERGTFSSYELSPAVSLGTDIAAGLSAGITLKYVYVSLAPKEFTLDGQAGTGDTFAADLGGLFDVGEFLETVAGNELPLGMGAMIGVNFQNLGPDISFIDEDQSDPIGRNAKVGLGLILEPIEGMSLQGEVDYNRSLIYSDEKPIWNFGGEGKIDIGGIFLAGRLGYIYDKDGDIRDPTFGGGVGLTHSGGSPIGGALEIASVPQARGLDRVTKLSLTGWVWPKGL